MSKEDAVAHRRIARTTLAQYEGRDNRCVRDVLCWLLLGPDSTRTGLRYCRPPALANELGWSVANIEAAIARLVADGHATYSPTVRTLLCHDALTCTRPANDSHRTSLRREIDVHQTCAATAKAVEMLGSNSDTVRRIVSDTVPDTSMQGAGCRMQDAEKQKTEQIAPTALVATATTARPKPADGSAQVIAAYNAICLSLARCEGKPGSAAAKAAAAAWRREPDLAAWQARFARAEASDFLTGRRGDFKADCLWLLNQTNAEKLDAGRYDPRDSKIRDPLQAAIAESTRLSQIAEAHRKANPVPEPYDEMPF